MFPYISRAYPGVPEDWRRVMRLVKYDKDLNIKSVHYFSMNCFVSSLGRLMKDGKIYDIKYDDRLTLTTTFTDREGEQVRFKRHQIVMQTFFMEDWNAGDSVDHIKRLRRYDNSIYNLRWAAKDIQSYNRDNANKKEKPVLCIGTGEIYQSCREAEDILGLSKNTVSRVCRGSREMAGGYRFCYL